MDIGFLAAATAEAGDIAEIARQTEAHGYESLWIPEHPVIPAEMRTPMPFTENEKLPEHYGRWGDPFVALAVAAAVTKKIRLATGICLLPEREPLITAKAVATLDLVSQGRVVLGVGAGWLREETEAMGANFGTRWRRTRETVEAMKMLWRDGRGAYNGETIKFPPVRCEPRPVRKSGPPVLLGAHGPKAIERVARSYDGWMPLLQDPAQLKRDVAKLHELAAKHGRQNVKFEISPLVEPGDDGLSAYALRAFRDAGATRIVLLSQKSVKLTADGHALDLIRRFAATVERARSL